MMRDDNRAPAWAQHHAPAPASTARPDDEDLIAQLIPIAQELATLCGRFGVRPAQLRGYAEKAHQITGGDRTPTRMESLCLRALVRADLRLRRSGRRVAYYSPSLFNGQ